MNKTHASNKPTVSVIINCHNGEKYLKEAIESIYSQTYTDWEIILFDNASTDESSDIAMQYDERLKYIYNDEIISLGAARKAAVDIANGEWISFLDVDDIWIPKKLELQMEALKNTNCIASYGGIREITPDGEKIRDFYPTSRNGSVFKDLLMQFDINMVTIIYNKKFAIANGLYFNEEITASEEYNLFMRMAVRGEILVQYAILGLYRVSENSLTNKQISKWAYERRLTLDKILLDDASLKVKFQNEFTEAYARADYYESHYWISNGEIDRGRILLKKISPINLRYKILYLISFSRKIWRMVHNKKIKLILSRYIKF